MVTPDTAPGVNYSGGLVYVSDLEGKITKVNLTNMPDDGAGNRIKLYDQTTLFTAGSTKANGRYMYHSMDATVGDSTNSMWLFAGTGDYERINDTGTKKRKPDNLMLGIRDKNYPYYKDIGKPLQANNLSDCEDTTGNVPGSACIDQAKEGWYIKLKDSAKVTAEPTVFRGYVKCNFKIFIANKCSNRKSRANQRSFRYICFRNCTIKWCSDRKLF